MSKLCPDLQLAVNAGFAIQEVKDLVTACGKLVKFFKKSSLATYSMESAQDRFKVKKHRLIQSCKTRWNSVYEMLQRLHEQKQCILAVLSDRNVVTPSKEESLSLSTAQWNRISSLLPVLEALQMATMHCDVDGAKCFGVLRSSCCSRPKEQLPETQSLRRRSA